MRVSRTRQTNSYNTLDEISPFVLKGNLLVPRNFVTQAPCISTRQTSRTSATTSPPPRDRRAKEDADQVFELAAGEQELAAGVPHLAQRGGRAAASQRPVRNHKPVRVYTNAETRVNRKSTVNQHFLSSSGFIAAIQLHNRHRLLSSAILSSTTALKPSTSSGE
jgi:hypothetical protein